MARATPGFPTERLRASFAKIFKEDAAQLMQVSDKEIAPGLRTTFGKKRALTSMYDSIMDGILLYYMEMGVAY
jgi:hypothetical protein